MVLSLLQGLCNRLKVAPRLEPPRLAPTLEEAYRLTEEQLAQHRRDTRTPNEAA